MLCDCGDDQIQLLKTSHKTARVMDISTADADDAAAAAAQATSVAAETSKLLLDALPLDEIKKRTTLQQQVRCAFKMRLAPSCVLSPRSEGNSFSLCLTLLSFPRHPALEELGSVSQKRSK
jgi:hypothetical protein